MDEPAPENSRPTGVSRRTAILSGALVTSLVVVGLLAQRRSHEPQSGGRNLPAVLAPAPTDEPVEVVCCAGWDAASRAPVSPMSEPVARAQDAAGGQYALVLFVGGVARAVVEVCWSARHAEVWFVDDTGRRYRGVAYRRWPDGRLRLFEVRGWRYAEKDTPEFHGDRPTVRARVHRDAAAAIKNVSVTTELPDGGSMQTWAGWNDWPEPTRPPEDVAAPSVDGWPVLAGMTGPVTVRSGPGEVPAAFPWRPPHPLRPRHVTEMTTEGARFRTRNGDVLTVRRTPAGKIRLPGGRLVVADPGWLDASSTPLAAAVPPGEYPLDVFQVTEDRTTWTAACRVSVTYAPVASWELALREGDVELELGDGEFYGNPVDTATVALVDQTGATAFSHTDIDAAMAGEAVYRTLSSGNTDLIIVPGWSDGACLVWLGRAADGSVSRFVVDLQVPPLATSEPA
ncbi:DUF4241 domain-containing protein [Lentzea flava]|uniref:DUF4178 domain-containing protein n=1 Tax=Lentzea flava TaxID=103732 RepID=A0ABQ2UNE7_9PSEU|nr:DUF4241 domain-containing protein [Lentzea flava]MCP2200388.1 Protein of unknown function (DUF4241) [Lentzea flava]GGU42940.1 hypothetical protein GCM10010178_39470 [Lentzea flava]